MSPVHWHSPQKTVWARLKRFAKELSAMKNDHWQPHGYAALLQNWQQGQEFHLQPRRYRCRALKIELPCYKFSCYMSQMRGQAILRMRVQIGAKLVRGYLPISGDCHFQNRIASNSCAKKPLAYHCLRHGYRLSEALL